METTPLRVLIYEAVDGIAPYSQWLGRLGDIQAAAKIDYGNFWRINTDRALDETCGECYSQ